MNQNKKLNYLEQIKANWIFIVMAMFLALLLIFMFKMSSGGFGASPSIQVHPSILLTEQEYEWLNTHKTLTFSVDDGNSPQNFRSEDGSMAGLNIDYMELLESRLGIRFDYIGSTWDVALQSALDHEVDGIISASIRKERLSYLNFTEVYTIFQRGFVMNKSSLPIEDMSSLNGRIIAAKKGSAHYASVAETFPEIELVEVIDLEEAFELLAKGEVDGIYDDVISLDEIMTKNHLSSLAIAILYTSPGEGDTTIGVRNDDPMIVTIMDKAIASITYEDRVLVESKWVHSDIIFEKPFEVDLNAYEIAWLESHPIIRVGSDPIWAPYEHINSDNIYEGITIDYLNIISEVLDVEFVQVYDKTWDELIELGKNKEVDLFTTLYKTEEREKYFVFSEPYLKGSVAIFTRSDANYVSGISDLEGKAVAIVENYAFIELIEKDYPDIKIVEVTSNEEGIEYLSQGQVDAYIDNMLTTADLLARNNELGIKVAGETYFSDGIHYGVREDWHILADILTKTIDAMPESEKINIQRKYVNIQYNVTTDYSTYFYSGLIVILLLLVAGFWIKSLSSEVKRRKYAEEEAKEARREAVQANLAKSEFLANMSHEIRTPLNAIIGYNYILQKSQLTSKQNRYVGRTILATRSLMTILNDILDYSKIEARMIDLELIEFDLYKVLHTTIDMVSVKALEKNLKVIIELGQNVPQYIKGDPTRLSQILLNLLNNSVKFTEVGHIKLSLNLKETHDNGLTLEFTVADTGIGISSLKQKALFESYVQEDPSITRRYGGTGLGLVICKNLIHLMGGEISVKSLVGRGTQFSFDAQFVLAEQLRANFNTKECLNILFACDDVRIGKNLLNELSFFGSKVKMAYHKDMLFDALEEANNYDMVIVDYSLREMGVIEGIRGLYKDKYKVVLLSHIREINLENNQNQTLTNILYYPIGSIELRDELMDMVDASRPKSNSLFESTNFDMYKSFEGKKILVAEDNELNQEIINEILIDKGFIVTIAEDGLKAIELCEKNLYDLILMDIQMPKMDGVSATKEIRKIPEYRRVPILALTAGVVNKIKVMAKEAGMNDYVSKPINIRELYQKIDQYL